jgi:ribosomal protein S18 acetylase RimI-like enzyme
MMINAASPADAGAILALQKLAFQSEARLYDDFSIPPLRQTLEELWQELAWKVVFKATRAGEIIGSVRGYQQGDTCYVERLIVHPDHQGRGLGTALMGQIEGAFPGARRAELFTGHKSRRNIRLYQRLGYAIFRQEPVAAHLIFVFMEKQL